jgi:hypothetical protein
MIILKRFNELCILCDGVVYLVGVVSLSPKG